MRKLINDPLFRILLGLCFAGLATLVWGKWIAYGSTRMSRTPLDGPTSSQGCPVAVQTMWADGSISQDVLEPLASVPESLIARGFKGRTK